MKPDINCITSTSNGLGLNKVRKLESTYSSNLEPSTFQFNSSNKIDDAKQCSKVRNNYDGVAIKSKSLSQVNKKIPCTKSVKEKPCHVSHDISNPFTKRKKVEGTEADDLLFNIRRKRVRLNSDFSNDSVETLPTGLSFNENHCKEVNDEVEIFGNESESDEEISIIHDNENNVETVDTIVKFITSSSEQKETNKLEETSVKCTNIPLELECTEERDSSDSDSEIVTWSSARIPENSHVTQNIASLTTYKCSDNFEVVPMDSAISKRSDRRTILIQPEPMKLRPHKIRGKKEVFSEIQNYHDTSNLYCRKQNGNSEKNIKLYPGKAQKSTMSHEPPASSKSFSIPRKSNIENHANSSDEEVVPCCSEDASNSDNFKSVNSILNKKTSVNTQPDIKAFFYTSAEQTETNNLEETNTESTNMLLDLECTEERDSRDSEDMLLDLECTEEPDSRDSEIEKTSCSARILEESCGIENSPDNISKANHEYSANFEAVPVSSEIPKRPVRKTLFTEPKPMKRRPFKIRGREEGFIERLNIHDTSSLPCRKQTKNFKKDIKLSQTTALKSAVSRKPSASSKIPAGGRRSRIPCKSNIQNYTNSSDKKVVTSCSDEASILHNFESINNVAKKKAPVKIQRKMFRSQSKFLVDNSVNKIEVIITGRHTQLAGQTKLSKNLKGDKSHFEKEINYLIPINISQDTSLDENSNKQVKNNVEDSNRTSDIQNLGENEINFTSMKDVSNAKPPQALDYSLNDSSYTATMAKANASEKATYSNRHVEASNKITTNHTSFRIPCKSNIQNYTNSSDKKVMTSCSDEASNSDNFKSINNVAKKRELVTMAKSNASEKAISSNRHVEKNYLEQIKRILNMNPIWLQEQAKCKGPPPVVSEGAANLPLCFKSYDHYVSSYYPMFMLDIWEYMYTESKEVYKSNKIFNKFYFSLLSYTSKNDYIELKCQSIINEKSYSPQTGCLVLMDIKNIDSKQCQTFLGYIYRHEINELNMDSIKNSTSKYLPKEWLTNAKQWTFYVYIKRKISFAQIISFNCLMKGNGICYLRNKLRLAEALNNTKQSPLLEDILQPISLTFSVNYKTSSHSRKYSSCQMQAIEGIYAEIKKPLEPKIILIQGELGTGKTSTIIGLLEKLILDRKSMKKILVVAPSNAAVNEIGYRLSELCGRRSFIKFVRVGSEAQINKKMIPYLLDNKAKELHKQLQTELKLKEEKIASLSKEISQFNEITVNYATPGRLRYLREEFNHISKSAAFLREQLSTEKRLHHEIEMSLKEKILSDSDIVLSTLNSCAGSIMLRTFNSNPKVHFSCCIIDESTQCTELEVLQPLVFGINKLVLFGNRQLSPTVTSNLACQYEFNRSMFERFCLFFKRCDPSPIFTLIR